MYIYTYKIYAYIFSQDKYSSYRYTYKQTHCCILTFYRQAKQNIVMCLKNSSTQTIIYCFALKYYFIDDKTFSSRHAFEDKLERVMLCFIY